jgi:hypothetical protein
LTDEQVAYRESEIRRHFPEAWVEGHEDLISTMTNHPKDRHVLAAAVRCHAEVIVTHNILQSAKRRFFRVFEPFPDLDLLGSHRRVGRGRANVSCKLAGRPPGRPRPCLFLALFVYRRNLPRDGTICTRPQYSCSIVS